MENNILDRIKSVENIESNLKDKFQLSLNPFPKSGVANISDSDEIVSKLIPSTDAVTTEIIQYMQDALSQSGQAKDNKYLSLIIRGDYGMGKTQTLMYIKYLFGQLRNERFQPYVVYIDEPGKRLSELIGNILSQIGIENFRRYLWDVFKLYMEQYDATEKDKLRKDILLESILKLRKHEGELLFPESIDGTNENNGFNWGQMNISYKYLLDSVLKGLRSAEQKNAVQILKTYLMKCFSDKYELSAIAEYFYDIVTDNTSVAQSWDRLITGDIKYIDKREVHILKAIVDVSKTYLNATDFIILVDEFEEIAAGRLKESDLDNYLRNLRSLIDKEKNWCAVFAMNGDAYRKILKMSPPLASRLGDRIIDLKPLDIESCTTMIHNYLQTARIEQTDSLYPFDTTAITTLLNVKDISLQGSPRFIIQSCYLLLQRAAEELDKGQYIDSNFVKKHLPNL